MFNSALDFSLGDKQYELHNKMHLLSIWTNFYYSGVNIPVCQITKTIFHHCKASGLSACI